MCIKHLPSYHIQGLLSPPDKIHTYHRRNTLFNHTLQHDKIPTPSSRNILGRHLETTLFNNTAQKQPVTTIAVLHTTFFSRQRHRRTAKYPTMHTTLLSTAKHINQQTANLAHKSFAVLHTTILSRMPQQQSNLSLYCKPNNSAEFQCSTAVYHFQAHNIIQQSMPLQHSNLSLYCTQHYSEERAILAQQSIAVLHSTLFRRKSYFSTAIYRCTARHNIQQAVSLQHNKLSLYCIPNYSAEIVTVAQQHIPVLQTKLFSSQCHYSTAIYRCTAQNIIQQTATVAQQTFAVLQTTLFSRMCHCSIAIYRCIAHQIIQQTVPLQNSNLPLY